MLGLGNAINKARVYKTFVGEAVSYQYLSEGSVGESGYIIGHNIFDSDDVLVLPEDVIPGGNYTIQYIEVYPEVVFLYPSSNPIDPSDKPNTKATAQEWGPYIQNSLVHVGDLDGDETTTSSDDWKIISPTEFDLWKSNIYNDPDFDGFYFEGDASNPYISVSPGYLDTWSANNFPTILETAVGDFEVKHTDSTSDYSPSYNDLTNVSYYTLAVRTLAPQTLEFFNQTPAPVSSPAPTEPSPTPYVLRSSGDLTTDVTDNPSDNSIDFSINADLLTVGDINMYFVDRPPSGDYDDAFKVQFSIEFEVDQSTDTVYTLPDPWGPSNTEQKKLYIDYAILGWNDFPFIDLPLDNDGLLEALASGVTPAEVIEYSGKLLTSEVDLNKVTNADLNNGFPLPDGQGGTIDGYYYKSDNTTVAYGYTGYLDLQNDDAGNLSSSLSGVTIREYSEGQGDPYLGVPSEKRYFIVRVLGLRYGTDERIPSPRVSFPQEMSYILMPIINVDQFGVFHNLVGSGGLADDFINHVFGASGQNSPPLIEGQNEDYYN